jgi:hypothetical protein
MNVIRRFGWVCVWGVAWTLSLAGSELRRLEYFIDADPGLGNGVSVEVEPGRERHDFQAVVDISSLSTGPHVIYSRALDSEGKWGHTESMPFYVKELLREEDDSVLEEIEVFVGEDPGFGKGVKLPLGENLDQTSIETLLDLGTNTVGSHLMGVRAKDSYGRWGHVEFMPYRVLYEYVLDHVDYRVVQGGRELLAGRLSVESGQASHIEMLIESLDGVTPGNLEIRAAAYTAEGIGAGEVVQIVEWVDEPLFFAVSGTLEGNATELGTVLVQIVNPGGVVGETEVGSDRRFRVEGVQAGAGYEIRAFEDRNGNGLIDANEPSLTEPLDSLGLFEDIETLVLSLEPAEPSELVRVFPADSNQDFQISVDEVTAYGAAWKNGTAWAVEPNPIPIDYVTWAGVLWLSGEGYSFDSETGEGHRQWTSLQVSESVDAASASSGIFRQSLSDWMAMAGNESTQTVTLQIQPPKGTKAWAVDVQLADASGELSRWGPFFDDRTRELLIESVSPAALQRVIASFDGETVTREFQAPQLSGISVSPSGRIRLESMGGFSGLRVEFSRDLKQWYPAERVVRQDDGSLLLLENDARGFFRVRPADRVLEAQ